MTGTVLVTAALGNVGRATVTALLDVGIPVRAADREADRVGDQFPDVEAVRLDFLDPSSFETAVEGCSSVLLLRPPPISKVKPTLNRFVDVAIEQGVGHVVFSSVQGADTNRVVPHHRVEQHLCASPVGWTMLRPGFFAQNLADSYRRDVVDADRIYVPAGHGRVAFIDAANIGAVAAAVLADPGAHRGKGYLLTGPEALTFDDVADALSARLGRTIRYEPATVLGYARHLHAQGLVPMQVLVQTILHTGLRRGDAQIVDATVERLLGRPARTMEQYLDDHLDLWRTS